MRILIHGGFFSESSQSNETKSLKQKVLLDILEKSKKYLEGNNAVDTSIFATSLLEDSPLFNAGIGSQIQQDGKIRMSAAIMDGISQKFSGVINIENVQFDDGIRSISDVIDASFPTSINIDNLTVIENIAGAHVANISATDPDDDQLSYTIEASDDAGMFEVIGNTLRLDSNIAANYEFDKQLEVTLRATDPGGLYVEKLFTIDVTDDRSDNTNPQIIIDINPNNLTYFIDEKTIQLELDLSLEQTFRYAFKEALIQSGYSNNSYMSGMSDAELSTITEVEYVNAINIGTITGRDNGNSISSSSLPSYNQIMSIVNGWTENITLINDTVTFEAGSYGSADDFIIIEVAEGSSLPGALPADRPAPKGACLEACARSAGSRAQALTAATPGPPARVPP